LPGRGAGRRRGDVGGGGVRAVLVAEQVLQQDLQAEGEAGRACRSVQLVDLVPLACDLKGRPAAEAVRCHRVLSLLARAVPSRARPYNLTVSRYQATSRGVRQEILTSSYLRAPRLPGSGMRPARGRGIGHSRSAG